MAQSNYNETGDEGRGTREFKVCSLKFKVFGIFILFQSIASPLFSQELNCRVEITSQRLQTADPKIFQTLKVSLIEFLNNRKWSNEVFSLEEKIECSMFINIMEEVATNTYRAQVNVQSSRPVFNSDYSTLMFNHSDKDWVFTYTEYQPLDFNENDFMSNLTSMLAFYAYLIIGLDYDSYSLNGGTPYFEKAQMVVNTIPPNMPSDIAPGWKPFDSERNRF